MTRIAPALVLALAAGLVLAGCGGGGERTADTGAAPAPATAPGETAPRRPETIAVRVYFVRDEQVAAAGREVPRTEAVGTAALEALLEGPTGPERGAGLTTSIPGGSRLLGLSIADGLATVDLSREFESGGGSLSMRTRVALVVYTVTQFPTVQRVAFRIEGRPVEAIGGEGVLVQPPVSRASFEDETPPILVETPAPFEAVRSPLEIGGTANVFEATFAVRLVGPDGRTTVERVVTATSGTGTRGTFRETIPFRFDGGGEGKLVAFEYSAEDGRPIHVVEIPLRFAG